MSAPRFLPRFLEAFLDTAFPAHCAACGETVDDSGYPSVCRSCVPRIQLIESPKCLTCGFPFFGPAESRGHCMHCEHLQAAFGQGWSVALFRGPVRALVHALKYEEGFWALRDLRGLFERAPGLPEFLEGAALVPVPLHPRKRRERGYNQSELIAEELCRSVSRVRCRDLLRRPVDTVSQTRFNRRERIRNLRNAFSLRRNRAIDPAQRYIIVDDVFTTGSTLNACAATLRRAGARRVDVLTVGHG